MNSLNRGQLYAHCRGHFMREFAWKTQKGVDTPNKNGLLFDLRRARTDPIRNTEHLIAKTLRYDSRPGQYVSIYAFERIVQYGDKKGNGDLYESWVVGKGVNYESAKLNRIYFDFDNEEEPQKAIDDALIVVKSLVRHGIYCHCYFSGGKGIAMYIEFVTLDIHTNNKKDVLKLFMETMTAAVKTDFNYELKCLDYKVSYDLARVSRIPNTKHKSGLYCIPVTVGDMRKGLEHIKIKAKEPSDANLDLIITDCMRRNIKMSRIMLNLEKQVITNREYKIKEQETKKKHWEKIKPLLTTSAGALTDEQIEHARNTPLSSLISNDTRMVCPLHHGDNPTSFYIDHRKNYYYCHSCAKSGSPIDYIMATKKLSFKEAVLALQ